MQAFLNVARRTASLAARSSAEASSAIAASSSSSSAPAVSSSTSSTPPLTRSLSATSNPQKRFIPHIKKPLDLTTEQGKARLRAIFAKYGGGTQQEILSREEMHERESAALSDFVRRGMYWVHPRAQAPTSMLHAGESGDEPSPPTPRSDAPQNWFEDETLQERLTRIRIDTPESKRYINPNLSKEAMDALSYIRGDDNERQGFTWGQR